MVPVDKQIWRKAALSITDYYYNNSKPISFLSPCSPPKKKEWGSVCVSVCMCVCGTQQFHEALMAVGLVSPPAAQPHLFVRSCSFQKSHPTLSLAVRFSQPHHLHIHSIHHLGLNRLCMWRPPSGSWKLGKNIVLRLVPEKVGIY